MVFLKKKNITKWEHLEIAAKNVGLNLAQFKKDYEGEAKELFNKDLQLARESGVRGFPTIFFADATGKTEMVYGSKPYSSYENALLKIHSGISKTPYDKSWSALFSTYHSLTAKEFTELTGTARAESEKILNELTVNGKLEKLVTKNGAIWTSKNASHRD